MMFFFERAKDKRIKKLGGLAKLNSDVSIEHNALLA